MAAGVDLKAVAKKTPGYTGCGPGQRAQRGRAADRTLQRQPDRRPRPRRGNRPRHGRPAEAQPRHEGTRDARSPPTTRAATPWWPRPCRNSAPGHQDHHPAPRPRPGLHHGGARRRQVLAVTRNELLDQMAYAHGRPRGRGDRLPRPVHRCLATTSRRPPSTARKMVTAVRHERTRRRRSSSARAAASRSWAATPATSATTPRRSPPIVDEETKKLPRHRAPGGLRHPRREPRRPRRARAGAARQGDARQGRRSPRSSTALRAATRASGLDRLAATAVPSDHPAGRDPARRSAVEPRSNGQPWTSARRAARSCTPPGPGGDVSRRPAVPDRADPQPPSAEPRRSEDSLDD